MAIGILFCFTKDAKAGIMKIYQNGALIAVGTTDTHKWSAFSTTDLSTSDQNNLEIGCQPNGNGAMKNMTGAVDEIAFFDADLSVDPITGAGSTVLGSVAPRFLDMYNMGTN